MKFNVVEVIKWHWVCSSNLSKYWFMTLREFNALKQEEQIGVVYNNGVYINDRFDREFTIVLYEVDEVGVELYYHERDIEPTSLKSFPSHKEAKYPERGNRPERH